ncbi:MAG TPA: hypothetical protein VM241_09245 [Candidatus Thermoplasmatota archaeon]|nr:hypothetical protein [Candidatus Thermoplasmatota archaeon]
MTGHKGERRNRAVALVTDDFRLYHRLVPFLESHGVQVLGLRPTDEVPAAVQVLLGGPAGDPRSVPLHDDLEATLLAAYRRLDRKPGRDSYRRVILGVDPGKVIGLAAVADGYWLLVGESLEVEAAVERLAQWAAGLAAPHLEVHIGAGAPRVGRDLLARLRRRLPEAKVSLVREEATTPGSHVTGSRHTDAAVHIALRDPL